MTAYRSEWSQGYNAYLAGKPQQSPYITDADQSKNTYWNQGWVDGFNAEAGSAGNLMPGGSDTAGQGGGYGNTTPVVTYDPTTGEQIVTTTPRATIAPSGLGSVSNGNVTPLPIVGIVNVAGDINVGGTFYANQQTILDDTLDVRLALTGHDTVQGTALIASGLTGSVAPSRYVGATASGHPTTGPHLMGDFAISQDGSIWICTTAGTPGSWTQVGGASSLSNPMSGPGDMIYGGSGGLATRLPEGTGVLVGGTTPAWTEAPTLTGEMVAQDFAPSGKTGATAFSAYAGATTTGHPTTGAHVVGEFVITQDGYFWICTGAGTPGTWRQIGLGGTGGADATAWHNTGDSYGAAGIFGTGDNYPVVVQSNGVERMRVHERGHVDLGTPGQRSDCLYLASAFSDSDTALYLLVSGDGLRWQSLTPFGTSLYAPGGLRDPSIMRYKGRYWVCHTGVTASNFEVAVSDDLITWTHVTSVSTSAIGSVTQTWAPEWFLDDDDTVHVTLSVETSNDTDTFRIYEMHPTNVGLTAWSAPVKMLNDSSEDASAWSLTNHSHYDSFLFKTGGYYYLSARNYNTGGGGVDMILWRSTSLLTGYLNYNVNMITDGHNYEGISIVQADASTWRAYLDKKNDLGYYYMESTDSGLTWTAPAILPLAPFTFNHGTIARITDLNTLRSITGAFLTLFQGSSGGVAGEGIAADFKATGLTGATAIARFVGATSSGAPATGTFLLGDFVIDQTGSLWVCTAGGTPGTWSQIAGGATTSSGPTGTPDVLRAYNTSATVSLTNVVWGAVPFDTNDAAVTTNSAMHSASSNTTRFVAPKTGRYLMAATVAFASNPTGSRYVGWQKNGAGSIQGVTDMAAINDVARCPMSDVVYLSAGDYIEVMALQGSGGSLSTVAGSGGSSASFLRLDGSMFNPMSGAGDLICGDVDGNPTRLAQGTGVLMGGATPSYSQAPTLTGEVTAKDFAASGKTGATAFSAYAGATASGAPTTGAHVVGEFVIDQTAAIWVCTVAGTPGTWVAVGGSGASGVFSGEVSATDFKATGLTGAVAASRYVGAVSSGHPTTGTFVTGDWAWDITNKTIYLCTAGGSPGTWAQIAAGSAGSGSFSGEVSGSDFSATGLTGSTAASRYVGATASGAPTTGAHSVGDFAVDQTGSIWICTTAGTPGTWVQVVAKLSADSDVSISSPASGDMLHYNGSAWVNFPMPVARISRVAAYSLVNGSDTALPFDTKDFDTGSLVDLVGHSTRISFPVAGKYEVSGSISISGNPGSNTATYGYLKWNGSTITMIDRHYGQNSGTSMTINVSDSRDCAASDYVEFYYRQNSGGSIATEVPWVHLKARRIG